MALLRSRISQIILVVSLSLLSFNAFSFDKIGRLGVGITNELANNTPAISFKIQKNRAMALGGIVNFNSNSTDGGYGAGLKFYKNIFDEPQLNFYFLGMAALLNKKENSVSYSGFQFNLGFGSEFHFTGLNSVGFSFEMGVTASKVNNFSFKTMGNNFIVSGIHFYL